MKLVMLNSELFHKAFNKITSSKNLSVKTLFKVKGMLTTIQNEVQKYEQTRMDLLKQYCKKNDKGELDVNDQGQALFLDEESQREFGEKMVELGNLDINVGTLNLSEIEKVEDLDLNDTFALGDLVNE